MSTVHLHYWAGARAAAGTATETVEAPTVRAAIAQAGAARGDHFRRVAASCTLLVDGLAAHEADLDRPLQASVRIELLPPFAGGAPV